jgi:hypothetical protein
MLKKKSMLLTVDMSLGFSGLSGLKKLMVLRPSALELYIAVSA